MPIRVIAVVAIMAAVGGSLMLHFRKQSLVKTEEIRRDRIDESDIPKPATGSALPKAVVVGEKLYDFGRMTHGEKGQHVFKLRNDGNAPLELVARKQDHSCQCTLGTTGDSVLQPGQETTVTLEWEIKNPAMHFQHWAKIRTNDPTKQGSEILFRVRGLVVKRLAVEEGTEISVGQVSEGKTTVQTLRLYSEFLDDFKVKSVTTSSPILTTSVRRLNAKELEELNTAGANQDFSTAKMAEMANQAKAQAEHALGESAHQHDDPDAADQKQFESQRPSKKAAYRIDVTIAPELPVGKFREAVTIETDAIETPLTIVLVGSRIGPIQILGTPGSGWSPAASLLSLGRFKASEGKKARLMVFVDKGSEELKVTSSSANPAVVTHQLVKDAKFNGVGREKFDLFVEVPAGSDPLTIGGGSPGSLILQTNHPVVKEIKIDLEFTSY